ncbi:unnamed protein product [Prunus armeniaca]
MVNLVQSKKNKEYRNKDTAAGKEKEKEKENNSSKDLKPMGLKCFFCKKTGHMKKECKSGASIHVTNSLQGVHEEEAAKQG